MPRSLASGVEFPQKENRGPAKDVVVVLQPAGLGLELLDLRQFLTGGSAALTAIDLRLHVPAWHALRNHPIALSYQLSGRGRVRALHDVTQHLLDTPLLDLRINLLRHDVHPPRLTAKWQQTWGGSG